MCYLWRWIFVVAGALMVVLPCAVFGEAEERPSEYDVKAAYLFNFARFVEWPDDRFASAEAPIVIGILGNDPFGDVLDQTVSDKLAQGRTVEVIRHVDLQQADSCHIVFVDASVRDVATPLLAGYANHGVLTVGDWRGFTDDNGIIEFVIRKGRVRFRIRPDLATGGGMTISAKLLTVGEVASR
ncbi:MAG: DUF4154 domain-containing protein [candidate division Zixibacteria bacterium]|nr:DUF4154 domain-containing protein [candidate division Zixibacteria bacterium]